MKIKNITTALAVLMIAPMVQAEVAIDWALVEDAGNSADNLTGYGSVDHNYRISKHEVTIGQYTEFLNAVASTDSHLLYNGNMATHPNIAGISRSGISGSFSYSVIGSANRPIAYVSWYDAARFVNWMENGQGAANTETGVYDLSGGGLTAATGASYWIPSEDEWYKAAYYDPSRGDANDGDNYWVHAMQSDTLVNNSVSGNYYDGDYVGSGTSTVPTGNALTDVGSYAGAESYYGTYDQGGNVSEWNDAVISGTLRGLRGGAWTSGSGLDMRSVFRGNAAPGVEAVNLGFRIAAAPVPEPSSVSLLAFGAIGGVFRRKRK